MYAIRSYYGGFEIAETLAGEDRSGIMLNCVVWDILEGKKLAVKNFKTNEIFYIQAQHLIVATGAIPFMPSFKNDDIPGVYTAAVVQKMMNNEFTLLGKNILTVGAGNIGYLTRITSYNVCYTKLLRPGAIYLGINKG